METDIVGQENIIKTLFKSYYVVWKLYILAEKSVWFWMFKSYYVVWKLVSIFIMLANFLKV